ncbi:MAG: hypothetical protein VXY94_04935 [Planctomycetota bacterium]|nr:hypothetical protein [Planctomycetota bacterium]
MSKLITRVIIIILLVLIILATLVVVFINSIAKSAITSAGTSTLGVPTTVGSVDIGILSGHSEIKDLEIKNPKDYPGDFLTLSDGVLDVNLGSLLGDSIEVTKMSFDGIDVSFIQRVKDSNVDVILDNVKKSGSGDSESKSTTDDKSDSGGRKFVIDELKVTNVKVAISIVGLSSVTKPSTVTIKEIMVKDIGKKEGGANTSQIMSIVVQSVVHSVLKAAPGEIPSVMMQGIKGGLSSLGNLDFGDVQFDAGDGLKKIGDSIGNIGSGAGDSVKDALDGIGKGIGGLLGNSDDKDKAKDDDSGGSAKD